MSDLPQVLLAHHLKALKLPTILREYEKVARQCAAEGVDFTVFLLRLLEAELIEREHRRHVPCSLRRHQPQPSGELASGLEALGIADGGDDGTDGQRPDAGNGGEPPSSHCQDEKPDQPVEPSPPPSIGAAAPSP